MANVATSISAAYSLWIVPFTRSTLHVVRRDVLVLAWYCMLALAAMAPVVENPRNVILGELGDNVHYVYMVGWSGQALLMGQSPFIDPRLNYPDDLTLSANDAPYLSFIGVAPFTWIFGPVFGYNLTIWLAHFCSGYFTYLWSRRLTSSAFAAMFAGTAFMLTPFRLFRSLGHVNMVSTQMIPLFFWALDECLRQRRVPEWRFWALGGATFLLASSSQYILVISLVTGAFYTLFFFIPALRLIVTSGWRIAVSVVFGTLIGSLPYFSVLGGGGFEPFNIGRTRLWSADPLNFLLPSSMHPLWGASINSLRPEPYAMEKTLYVSIVALAIALLGLAFGRAYRDNHARLIVWIATACVAGVLALGTDLWINNEPISIDTPVWLPAYYLAKLPLLNIMRVWSRFGITTIFFVAMLAGWGVMVVMQRIHHQGLRRVIAFMLMLLLLIDIMPGPLPHTLLQPRSIDRWLAQQDGDFAVAFLPVDKPLVNDLAIFGSLFHGKQMPAYVHAAHLSRAYKDFAALALEFPSRRSIEYLRWRKYKYIILDKAEYNGWRAPKWADLEAELSKFPEIRRVVEVDQFVVLAFQ